MVYNNDTELMEAFKRGDEDCFRYIYSATSEALIKFSHSIIRNDNESCRDVVGGAFMKLWANRSQMQSFEHIRRYLYVITKNASIDELRHFTKKRRYEKDEEHLNTMSFDTYETHVLTNMILIAMFQIRGAVRSKVIHMIYKGDKTTAQIADTLGISGQTVLNHKTRALAEIRTLLKPTPKTIHQEIARTFARLSGLCLYIFLNHGR
jgi:RNA polymerase sigma factor (sigma-70 family)